MDAAPALTSTHEEPTHVYIYTNPAHERLTWGLRFRNAYP